MSEKLPRIPAERIIAILKKKGIICVRQKGSHKIFRDDSGIRVTIPDHTGKILHPKILKQICMDCGITVDELS
jgi:predicted RNA binding protein YcfA (HicA-like mRNA interferase family)